MYFRLGDGDRQAIAAIDVQHHMHIRASIPYINDAVGADLQRGLELVQHRDFAIARRHPEDGLDLSRGRIVLEARAVNPLAGDDVCQCRLDHLLGSGRNHVEREPIAINALLDKAREPIDVFFEPNPLSDLDQVRLAHTPICRVVSQQVSQLSAFLHEVEASQP
jgi:hypothetical protein